MRSSSMCIALVLTLVALVSSRPAAAQNAPAQNAPAQNAPPPPPVYVQQPYPPATYPPPVYAQQPAYPPPLYVAQPQKPRPPRPRRGLMIAGISTLAASYAVGIITGAILVETHCCESAGWSLFAPVAGPFMAAKRVPNGKGALALLGAVQTIGAGLTIAGIVVYAISSNDSAALAANEFQLREGRSLALDVSTSPYLTGPSMRLRF